MRDADVRLRAGGASSADLRRMKKGLLALHTLELMAVNIYRCQIARHPSALNRALIAAMCNEMTHLQDFQVKLYEYGWRPSPLRWVYGLAGSVLGLGSRLMGEKTALKMGVWVETKAVRHYSELLGRIAWDEETRSIIEKNQADEYGHVERWMAFLRGGE
ncbi:MAG: demethoxyubiquinone hydroxylase family protein [Candidatus Krumholzibacteria bacterium]|nr:demethoxyubiquinone hydroxylase family protein [Candidatus Krumholzibacteria bacterium]